MKSEFEILISENESAKTVFFEKLNITGGKKNKAGNYHTDEASLLKVSSQHPIIEKILD